MPPRLEAAPRRGGVLCCAALVWAACPSTAQAGPVTYRLDPDHSFVTFEILHFHTSTIRGRFGPINGEVDLDSAAGTGHVGLRIPMSTLDTGFKVFDHRICERDLLDCAGQPEAYFVATQFKFSGSALQSIRGEFTLRGTSQPLTLTATHFGCYQHPMLKREVCGGDFEAEFLRSDFGATFGIPFVADSVKLKIQVEGVLE